MARDRSGTSRRVARKRLTCLGTTRRIPVHRAPAYRQIECPVWYFIVYLRELNCFRVVRSFSFDQFALTSDLSINENRSL